jgi:acyl-CoA synthetase (AMP-forming)/AMP-acid ligase II/thioesterase domain-containing protein/acyl carrier protein
VTRTGRPGAKVGPIDDGRPDASLPDAFRAAVAIDPDATAVDDTRHPVTYAQLDARSNAVAAAVRGGDGPVAVLAGHGPAVVAAMLGAAKAARPYLVLDPRAPEAYWRSVLVRVGVADVLLDAAHEARRPALGDVRALDLGALPPGDDPRLAIDPRTALSVSFTSGTSGVPKAVVHDHRNVVRNARRVAAVIDARPDDRVLVSASFAFVSAATPTFVALLTGATACPYEFGSAGSEAFFGFADRAGITVGQFTPALLPSLGRHARVAGAGIDSVRVVMVGGDRLQPAHLQDVRDAFPRAALLHRFNTSETNWVAGAWLDPDAPPAGPTVPLGWPVPWVDVRVVDDVGVEVAPGEVGELVVRSDTLALGYLGDPDATAARFVDTPEGREYWTRDRVCVRADGQLEFTGRADATAKVRGMLVDPGIVESALERCPGVTSAAVVVTAGTARGARVVAFATGRDLRARDLRRRLAASVPPAMVPSVVVPMLELPLTDRGKVDRRRLLEVAEALPRPDYQAPRDESEARIAALFSRVLLVDDVGRDDDFYALGGDSLASVELLALLDAELGLDLSAAALLESPTPAQLSERLRPGGTSRQHGDSHLVRLATGPEGSVPLVAFSGAGGGNAEAMAYVARALGDRTCYIAMPRAFEYRGRADRTVADAATTAAGDIMADIAEGPIAILGHSSGGNIAMETARLLAARGREVRLVVLLDTMAMTSDALAFRTVRFRLRSQRAATVRIRAARGQRTSRLRLAYWNLRGLARVAVVRWQAATAGLLRRDARQQRAAFTALRIRQLARHHEAPYDGPVLLLRADPADEHPHRAGLRDLFWGDVVGDRLTVVDVAGSHEQLVEPPYVDEVATAIRGALEGA